MLTALPSRENLALQPEEYAHSHSKLRPMGAKLGHLAVAYESLTEYKQAYADFRSSLHEMLRTDPEFHGQLDIDNKREHTVVDNHVRDIDGVPMVEVIARGRHISEAIARFNKAFEPQAVRDACDEQTAYTADALLPGESWIAVSMEPKTALKRYKKTYEGLGYKEGLLYIQWYAKVDLHKLIAGSCSVDMSDETLWRQLLAEEGAVVPENESPDTWLLHGMRRQFTAEQTEAFVLRLRDRYYERRGVKGERHSVSEYIGNNETLIKNIFDTYYPELAKAIYTERNSPMLQAFASALMQTDLSNMDTTIRADLVKIANSGRFDDELGKTMDAVLRYAVVEELRKNLGVSIHGNKIGSLVLTANQSWQTHVVVSPHALHVLLAGNVQSGVQAGRSYGGCAGQVKVSKDSDLVGDAGLRNLQDAYSGLGVDSEAERIGQRRKGECVIDGCPTRPYIVEVGGCGVCLDRCQKIYDEGGDPTEQGTDTEPPEKTPTTIAKIISLEEKRQNKHDATEQGVEDQPDFRLAAA